MHPRLSDSESRQNIIERMRRTALLPRADGSRGIVPLGFAPVNGGGKFTEIFPYGSDWHASFEWMWLCGEWTHIKRENSIYRMAHGDFCLIEPGLPHAEMYTHDTPPHESLWFSYSSSMIHASIYSYDAPGHGQIIANHSAHVPEIVGTLLVALQSEINKSEAHSENVCQGLLAALAHLLMRALETTALSENDASIKGHASRLALDYLRRNYARNISLAEIAHNVHLSPTHLATVFKRETGKTIGETLTAIRLERAKSLLVEERLPIREVAAAVGFHSPEHFCRVFQRHEKVPPSLYCK